MEHKEVVKGQRIAKIIANSGYCSRREAERLIEDGVVKVNGKIIDSPATIITDQSIKINDKLINPKQKAKIWIFHKPKNTIVSNNDPQNRKTIFSILPENLPRVITIGRLDINTEGLLLLTNNGEIARHIELPKTAWSRVYRVRVFGKINMNELKKLEKGIKISGIRYGSIKIEMEREGDFNSWIKVTLKEGKNREIKKVLEHFGLQVNRLIRISFGPFHLGSLSVGEVKAVENKVLESFLGDKI
ncbi:rRNA pseudouridine synthase [Rickettsiales bacterium]|nr:rRNA pseudouridine synthase [Rickettsiales bacterium]